MPLSEELLKRLNKVYEPSSTIQFRFRGKDVALITDKEGQGMQFFIGQLKENGNIKGDRYSRKIVKDRSGQIVRDHWDRKGRST